MDLQEVVAYKQDCRIKCTKCNKWYNGDGISRDGYWIHHKNFRLESIIISHIFVCYSCSTYWGRFKSMFVRLFGRIYNKLYLTPQLEKMIGKKIKQDNIMQQLFGKSGRYSGYDPLRPLEETTGIKVDNQE